MVQPATIALTLIERMVADGATGVNAELMNIMTEAGVELPLPAARGIVLANIPADVVERSGTMSYPSIHIYCERTSNELKEKFRAFSGPVDIVIELRVTHDHPEEAPRITEAYVTAITSLLLKARGRWAESLFYPGTYEVIYGPVKRGGKNYLQITKVRLQVLASI